MTRLQLRLCDFFVFFSIVPSFRIFHILYMYVISLNFCYLYTCGLRILEWMLYLLFTESVLICIPGNFVRQDYTDRYILSLEVDYCFRYPSPWKMGS